MNNKIIMHINYAERGFGCVGAQTIDDICRFAAKTGFDGIEFRGAIPKELSVLSFREYAEHNPGKSGRYILVFSAFNFIFLAVMLAFASLIGAILS